MRILALAWTTVDSEKELMINQRADLICPAIDGITDCLLKRGHQVVYVNIFSQDTKCLSHISGLPYHKWEDIKNRKFDVVWHCIKDPTPVAALEAVRSIMNELPPDIPVWNNVEFLKDHTKDKYIALLRQKNVGAIILEDYDWGDYKQTAFPSSNGCFVSKDYSAIRVSNRNSGRIFPLFSPEGGVTLKYQNMAKNPKLSPEGHRTFFRIPYAAGKCLEGFKYYCPADILCPKTGAAIRKEPFAVGELSGASISAAMNELGITLAHLEGVEAGFAVEIFDVNPFPSSAGATLTPISEKIAERLEQVYSL